MLYLVRHAMPEIRPEVPPAEWELGARSHRDARALAGRLPAGGLLVASAEPKARQTLEPAGPVRTDERFNEVWRDEPYGGDFRARRLGYVTGTDHPGWEPRDEAAARFAAGVRYWLSQVDGRPLVIASHGMAMTLWLTATGRVADPGTFWAGLQFPDLVRVDTC